MGKISQLIILLALSLSIVANELPIDEFNPLLTADPSWPRQCAAPNCNVVNRSLRYPSTLARQFFQCSFVNNVWTTLTSNCPCDRLFDYMQQTCVRFDEQRIEWCTNNVNSDWISCGTPGPITTTTAGVTTTLPETTTTTIFVPETTTTTEATTTTTQVMTTLPPGGTTWNPPGVTPPPGEVTTTTERYSTMTWG